MTRILTRGLKMRVSTKKKNPKPRILLEALPQKINLKLQQTPIDPKPCSKNYKKNCLKVVASLKFLLICTGFQLNKECLIKLL